MTLSPSILEMPVKDIIFEYPHSLPVFEQYNLDYGNRGTLKLKELAGEEQYPDVERSLKEQLEGYRIVDLPQETDIEEVKKMDVHQLVNYIVKRFHAKLRNTIPTMKHLSAHLHKMHPENARIKRLKHVVHNLLDDILHHIDDEEDDLFPRLTSIRQLTSKDQKEVLHLVKEHVEENELMEQVRKLTHNYTTSPSANWIERHLVKMLRDLANDTHTHFVIENYHLFTQVTTEHLKSENRDKQESEKH